MTERVMTDANGRKYITTEPFKPDYNTEAVLVDEMQRMAKRIEELEAELKTATVAEREACAKVCDDINANYEWPDDVAERLTSQWCADAIRARGQE
jgi:hypothetical protein